MKSSHAAPALLAAATFLAACTPSSGSGGSGGARGSGGTSGGGTGGASVPTFGSGGASVPTFGTGGTTSPTGSGGSAGPTGSGGNSGGGGVGGGAGGSATPGTGGAMAMPCMSNPADYEHPFKDPCKPLEERVTNLLSLLTADEKIGMLHENQQAVSRLGIPFFTAFTEGTHGLGWSNVGTTVSRITATQFPQSFGLAHSWDPEVMRIVGDTTAVEARVYNAQGKGVGIVIRAPVIDLVRHPLWGRTEEGFGEDPYLTSELAKAFVAGLHGNDPTYLMATSTLKHFVGATNETNRNSSTSMIDERNMREYYAVPFYEAMKNGKAQSVMTAYQKINEYPGAITPLVKSLLLNEWGFDGMVCIDAYAANALIAAQPGGHQYMNWNLMQAVTAIIKSGQLLVGPEEDRTALRMAYMGGMLTMADLDGALRGNLRMRFRLGDFDPPARVPYKKVTGNERPWDTAEYKARALDVSRRTVVLLKNADNALPLDKATVKSVAVIGPRADSIVRDWYGGVLPYKVTVRQGIINKVGSGVMVRYAADDTGGAAVNAARMSDVAIVAVGNHPICGLGEDVWGMCPSDYEGREAFDRKKLGLDPAQQTLVQNVLAANPKTIVVLVSGTPQGLGPLQQTVPAIVHIANSGQEIGNAVADVLFGDYNPAGRTNMTWYASETDIPTSVLDYDIRKGTTYWYFAGTPLYPFGHGLSYTSFDYDNVTLSANSVSMTGSVNVSVDVTNIGTRAGDEVVQLYVSYPTSTTLPRPRQQLRGFKRVTLMPGQTQKVTFALPGSALTYWDTTSKKFALQQGMVQVQVGASSKDLRATVPLSVTP